MIGISNNYHIPEDWSKALAKEIKKEYFTKLINRLKKELLIQTIYPSPSNWFSFMNLPLKDIKIVIIGQDPYHGPDQAHGLCFSVQKGVKIPPSLKNIYKELENDIDGFKAPDHGYLQSWADQGVLLLNATLTVQKGKPNSHAKYGWDKFTDSIIDYLNNLYNIVFFLWGSFAHKKGKHIILKKHLVLKAVHPSPLGANRGGWFGSKHFSKANAYLIDNGKPPINWNSVNTL